MHRPGLGVFVLLNSPDRNQSRERIGAPLFAPPLVEQVGGGADARVAGCEHIVDDDGEFRGAVVVEEPEQALGCGSEVLATASEVVEQVVWEVVPQLAEMLIKEEIARLTKEG